jgi:hypothetical protein
MHLPFKPEDHDSWTFEDDVRMARKNLLGGWRTEVRRDVAKHGGGCMTFEELAVVRSKNPGKDYNNLVKSLNDLDLALEKKYGSIGWKRG